MSTETLHRLAPAFSDDEYRQRVARTKEAMEERGFDVLIVADPANMYYLTGYDAWSFYTPQVVLLALDADNPVWIGRGVDTNGARMTTWLEDEDIVGYPDHYLHAGDTHPMVFAAQYMHRRGWARARIGIERDAYFLSATALDYLNGSMPQAQFEAGDLLVNWIRAVKSEAEIHYMKEAGRITAKAVSAATEFIRPGVRQCDAAAHILQAQISGTPEYGGDYTAIVPMLPSGPGTATPHLTWTDAPFRNNEPVVLEVAGCRRRYHCPLSRTFFLGSPPDFYRRAAETIVHSLHAALESVRAGVEARAVSEAFRVEMAAQGLEKPSRLGYSIGAGYPPDWGEHTINLRAGDQTRLQANMTFHCLGGFWARDWGVQISEAIRVTPTGYERLSTVTPDLQILG